MSVYKFSNEERYAVFTVHHERCWLCETPISLAEVQVDHIIPESLVGTPEGTNALKLLGLPSGFDLNSFENWVPAHARCNRIKADTIFHPTPLIQARLQIAEKRAPKARELVAKYASDRRIDRAIHELLIAGERGLLGEAQKKLIATVAVIHDENRDPEERGKPLMIAPWLTLVGEDGNWLHLRGPGGMVGSRPKGDKLHSSWDCPRCGPTAWNGVRCVTCGMMDDGD